METTIIETTLEPTLEQTKERLKHRLNYYGRNNNGSKGGANGGTEEEPIREELDARPLGKIPKGYRRESRKISKPLMETNTNYHLEFCRMS